MNIVSIVGRLTRPVETRYTQGEKATAIARFSVAVDRRFKKDGGDTADFLNCIAFGKTGEFVEKYFDKGMRIGLTGRIQTGKYVNKDGITVYTTDIVAEQVEFVESKGSGDGGNSQSAPAVAKPEADSFINIPDGIDEELPFN